MATPHYKSLIAKIASEAHPLFVETLSDLAAELSACPQALALEALPVTCWCETTTRQHLWPSYAMVDREEIKRGNTWSCGRKGCRPPNNTAAAKAIRKVSHGMFPAHLHVPTRRRP